MHLTLARYPHGLAAGHKPRYPPGIRSHGHAWVLSRAARHRQPHRVCHQDPGAVACASRFFQVLTASCRYASHLPYFISSLPTRESSHDLAWQGDSEADDDSAKMKNRQKSRSGCRTCKLRRVRIFPSHASHSAPVCMQASYPWNIDQTIH